MSGTWALLNRIFESFGAGQFVSGLHILVHPGGGISKKTGATAAGLLKGIIEC